MTGSCTVSQLSTDSLLKDVTSIAEISTFSDITPLLCSSLTKPIADTKVIIREFIYNHTHSGAEEPFYVGDIGELERQHKRWIYNLPRVEPFYAVKCNPNPVVLARLASLGTGFDCASQKEMEMVLALGVDPSRIIFANPCKPPSHIRFAREQGIHRMTVDNEDEILKISKIFPDAELVFRILVDDSNSICRFGIKFGMNMATAERSLSICQNNSIKVIGVSFHVGSGCMDPDMFIKAIIQAKELFDIADTRYGYTFTFLDIGGGFPGANTNNNLTLFERVTTRIRPIIDELFPDFIQVIAEPGRYFASSVFTLCVRVNARRVVRSSEPIQSLNGFMYYVNDGAYGSFNCLIYDHAIISMPYFVRIDESIELDSENGQLYDCSIWGPTCDSMDCITRSMLLPELNIGDWLCFDNMGAYTMAASSTFNGFPKGEIFYVNSESGFSYADAIKAVTLKIE